MCSINIICEYIIYILDVFKGINAVQEHPGYFLGEWRSPVFPFHYTTALVPLLNVSSIGSFRLNIELFDLSSASDLENNY